MTTPIGNSPTGQELWAGNTLVSQSNPGYPGVNVYLAGGAGGSGSTPVSIAGIVPISQTQFGDASVDEDSLGLPVRIIYPDNIRASFGAIETAELTPVVALSFNYNINNYFVLTGTANGGTVLVSSSQAVLSTNTGSSGSVFLESRLAVRYNPGKGVVARFTSVFTTGSNGNSIQEIGMGDSLDGFFFAMSGTSFGVVRRQNGVDTFVSQSVWNGPDKFNGSGPSGITLDPAKGNVYQIKFQWLGYGAIRYYVENPSTGFFALVHTIKYANTNTTPSILNPTLPLRMRAQNFGGTTNLVLRSPSMGASVYGPLPTQGAPGSTGTTVNTTAEVPCLSLYCTGSFQGRTNRVRVKLMKIGVASGGGAVGFFRVLQNPVLTGANFVPFDANTSVVSLDSSATTFSGGREIFRTRAPANGSETDVVSDLDLRLNPGDVFTITARSGAGATSFTADVAWQEEFSG